MNKYVIVLMNRWATLQITQRLDDTFRDKTTGNSRRNKTMAKKKWEIRAYQPGDEEGILELFNGVFSENNPAFIPRKMKEWHWQFRDSPLGNQTTVAIDEDGRLIGQYTSIPFRTWIRGKEEVTSQIVDTCIAVEYQRSLKQEGVFLSVAALYFDIFAYGHPTVLCYGYPVPNAQRIGVRFLGYIPVLTPVTKLVADVDAGMAGRLEEKSEGIEVKKVDRFGEGADALWNRLKEGIGYTIFRNAEFLNWRYLDHPRVNYHGLQAFRDNEVVGVMAYRIGWYAEKITPILELFTEPGDTAAQAALLAAAARHAVAEGCPRFELWLPPNGVWFKAFPSFGFREDVTRFNLINRLFADWMNNEWLMENYFFTMGDTDIY